MLYFINKGKHSLRYTLMQKTKKACTKADRIGLEHAFINLDQTITYYHVDSTSFRLHTLRNVHGYN